MNLISRHLPPLRVEDSKVPLIGKVILLGILGLIGYWIYSSPLKATIGLGTFAALIGGAMFIEARRVDILLGFSFSEFRKAGSFRSPGFSSEGDSRH